MLLLWTRLSISGTMDQNDSGGSVNHVETNLDQNVSNEGRVLRKNPKLSEKGRENAISTHKNLIASSFKRLEKQILVLNPLLETSNVDLVNQETQNLDRMYQELTDTHSRLCELLSEAEDKEEYVAACVKLDEVDSKYFAAKENICTWQIAYDKELRMLKAKTGLSEDGSSSSGSSKSRRSKRSGKSRHSQRSDCSNTSLRIKAKIAGLKAEAEALELTSQAELTAALLKKQQKIKKMEAMEKVYEEEERKSPMREVEVDLD